MAVTDFVQPRQKGLQQGPKEYFHRKDYKK